MAVWDAACAPPPPIGRIPMSDRIPIFDRIGYPDPLAGGAVPRGSVVAAAAARPTPKRCTA